MIMARRIRDCRKASGKTQKELASDLGVKEAAVSKWENGTVENIPRSTIKRMSELFCVNPCYLMGFTDDPNPAKGSGSIYDRVTIELGAQAGELLKMFISMNSTGRDMTIKAVEAFANMPDNTIQEKTKLRNA